MFSAAIPQVPRLVPRQLAQCPESKDPPTFPGGSLGRTRDSSAPATGGWPFRVRDHRRSGPSRSQYSRRKHPPTSGRATARRAVRNVVARLRSGLVELFALPEGYEVVLGNGGTTAFWDAATFLSRRGEEPAPVLRRVLLQVRRVHPGSAVPRGARSPRLRTGHLPAPCRQPGRGRLLPYPQRDLDRRAGRCAPPSPERRSVAEGLVLVDATSAAGGLRVEADEFDVYYFAPQKCFGSEGGLWLALLSPAAIERIERLAATGRFVPGLLGLEDRSRRTRASNRPTTRRLWPPCSCSPSRWTGSSATVASSGPPRGRTAPPRSSTGGPSVRASRGRS